LRLGTSGLHLGMGSFGFGADRFGLRACRLGLDTGRFQFSARCLSFGTCRSQFGACRFSIGLRSRRVRSRSGGVGSGYISFRARSNCLHASSLDFSTSRICLRPRGGRIGPNGFGFGPQLIRFGPGSIDLCLGALDLALCDGPGCIELLLRVRAQVLKGFAELGDLHFRRSSNLIRMLLRDRANMGYLPFSLRSDTCDESLRLRTSLGSRGIDRRVDGLLTLFRRSADCLLRKSAQVRFEVLTQAAGRALERRADLIVECHRVGLM